MNIRIHIFLLNEYILGYNIIGDGMNYRKKHLKLKKVLFIAVLVICFIMGYIANIVMTNRNLSVPEKAIKDGVLTIQKVISYPFDFVINKIKISKEKAKIYNEYVEQQEQLSMYDQIITENKELKKQIQELQELLNIDTTLIGYETINASVISRDLSYWGDNLIIDKGQNDGIVPGMAVVVAKGLIGKVVQTTTYSSTVRLLTSDIDDKISVKIQNGDNYAYGILTKYNNSSNTYSITSISQDVSVPLNSIVTTTGMGDIYPAGIIVGYIYDVSRDNFDLYKIFEMKTFADFNNINYVKVLKRSNI